MTLSDLEPKEHHRVIDLLAAARYDVNSWSGPADPRCMEWSFLEAGQFVVLNIEWRPGDTVRAVGDQITYRNNMLGIAKDDSKWQRRKKATRFDEHVREAWEYQLPIHVVFFKNRGETATSDRQEIGERSLDQTAWVVRSYAENGEFTLLRGGAFELPGRYVDQFTAPDRYQTTGLAFKRSAIVRSTVLSLANGTCERCGELGFAMAKNKVYLETHHVKSLANEGTDAVANVVAICPNCHRMAHFSLDRDQIYVELLSVIGARSRIRK